jgi:hypothetical protein
MGVPARMTREASSERTLLSKLRRVQPRVHVQQQRAARHMGDTALGGVARGCMTAWPCAQGEERR